VSEICYFQAKTKTTGKIEGTCSEKGFEKTTVCYSVDFGGIQARDAASGNPTGKRRYQPIKLVTKLEESCVLWLQAFANNDEITDASIQFPVKDVKQGKIPYLKIQITSGHFSACRIVGPDTFDSANHTRPHFCEVEIVARKWEVTHFAYQEAGNVQHRGGVTATDQWDQTLQ
jgi:type VI secretion system secreted protein Hcp